ncbi:MAG: hypothetical protein AAF743_02300 [Planctomycetota bacterium]
MREPDEVWQLGVLSDDGDDVLPNVSDDVSLWAVNTAGNAVEVYDSQDPIRLNFDELLSDGTRVLGEQLIDGELVVSVLSDIEEGFVALPVTGLFHGAVAIAGLTYFNAVGGVWRTDGTAVGTELVVPDVLTPNLDAAGDDLIFRVGGRPAPDALAAGLYRLAPNGQITALTNSRGTTLGFVGTVDGRPLFRDSNDDGERLITYDADYTTETILFEADDIRRIDKVADGFYFNLVNETRRFFTDLTQVAEVAVVGTEAEYRLGRPIDVVGRTAVVGVELVEPFTFELAEIMPAAGFVNGIDGPRYEVMVERLVEFIPLDSNVFDDQTSHRVIDRRDGPILVLPGFFGSDFQLGPRLGAVGFDGTLEILLDPPQASSGELERFGSRFEQPPVPALPFLVFDVEDPLVGIEPFFTDGTSDGTKLVADFNTTPFSSSPLYRTVIGDLAVVKQRSRDRPSAPTNFGLPLVRSDGTVQRLPTFGPGAVDEEDPGLRVGDRFILPFRQGPDAPNGLLAIHGETGAQTIIGGDTGATVGSVANAAVIGDEIFVNLPAESPNSFDLVAINVITGVSRLVRTGESGGQVQTDGTSLYLVESDEVAGSEERQNFVLRINPIDGSFVRSETERFATLLIAPGRPLVASSTDSARGVATFSVFTEDGLEPIGFTIDTNRDNLALITPIVRDKELTAFVTEVSEGPLGFRRLFMTDGTAAGTRVIADYRSFDDVADLPVVRIGDAFFIPGPSLSTSQPATDLLRITAEGADAIDIADLAGGGPIGRFTLSTGWRGSIFLNVEQDDQFRRVRLDLDLDQRVVAVAELDVDFAAVAADPDDRGPLFGIGRFEGFGTEPALISDERAPLVAVTFDRQQAVAFDIATTEPLASVGAFSVVNLDAETTLPATDFVFDGTALTYAPRGVLSPLPTGRYELRLNGVVDLAGNVSAPTTLGFDFLNGDLDGDRDVDLNDAALLERNFGRTDDPVYNAGDLDFDGDVDLTDAALLERNFGAGLPSVRRGVFAAGPSMSDTDDDNDWLGGGPQTRPRVADGLVWRSEPGGHGRG